MINFCRKYNQKKLTHLLFVLIAYGIAQYCSGQKNNSISIAARAKRIGASGKADIASEINVLPCNRLLIASISKSLTATTIFKLVYKGMLSLNDPGNKWISKDITGRLENTNQINIRQNSLDHV
jgi:CubicO group peptidase (beta-lactamase class C family)